MHADKLQNGTGSSAPSVQAPNVALEKHDLTFKLKRLW